MVDCNERIFVIRLSNATCTLVREAYEETSLLLTTTQIGIRRRETSPSFNTSYNNLHKPHRERM